MVSKKNTHLQDRIINLRAVSEHEVCHSALNYCVVTKKKSQILATYNKKQKIIT